MAVQQIEELCLQCRARTTGIEVGQERILGLFEHGGCVETGSEARGERSLADADRSFDRDVPMHESCDEDAIIAADARMAATSTLPCACGRLVRVLCTDCRSRRSTGASCST